jgi:predicted amidohydrolase
MQFHAIQHDVIHNNVHATQESIEMQLSQGAPHKGDYVVLSEMTTSGFSMNLQKTCNIGTPEWGCAIAKKYEVWLQIGWAREENKRGKNCVSICSPNGEIVGTYEKVFTCNPLLENRSYDCGNSILIVEIEGQRVCPMICYDLRFPELWRIAAMHGVDIFTISSSWPIPRIQVWKTLLIARAMENQAFIVASNRIGEDELAKWGGCSSIISTKGKVMMQCGTEDSEIISAELLLEEAVAWRNEFPILDDLKKELLGSINVQHIIP